jgi:GTP cyclohydrolase I
VNKSLLELHLKESLSYGLGLNLDDPNLKDTPKRIMKMWTEEFFSSVEKDGFENLTVFPNEKCYDQIIMLDRIHFVSMCSHHFLPFSGLAWLAYIPRDCLAGASKPSRLIDFYSKKPQLQETLSQEVLDCFNEKVNPRACLVLIRGIHGCMSERGVLQYNGSGMMTSAISGVFKTDSKARSEAMDMIKISLMIHNL